MANYIFLDIDGVLNNSRYMSSHFGWGMNPRCLRYLRDICKNCNAKVILSSGWRRNLNDDLTVKKGFEGRYNSYNHYEKSDVERLIETFKRYEINLVGKTDERYIPTSKGIAWDRAGQIVRYIETHLNKDDKYLILDDEDIISKAYPGTTKKIVGHFIQTDYHKYALDKKTYNQIIDYFNK